MAKKTERLPGEFVRRQSALDPPCFADGKRKSAVPFWPRASMNALAHGVYFIQTHYVLFLFLERDYAR